MTNKRKALTLVEILLSMVLTGIIALLAMKVLIFVTGNYKQVYYSAYVNLKHAVGEIMSNDSTRKIEENDVDSKGSNLCDRLAKVYDIIESSSICSIEYDFSPSTTFQYNTPDLTKPSFVVSNGQRFYVGKFFKPAGTYNYFNQPATLVMIDLNGIAGPNAFDSINYAGKETPDIVAFAVLQDGTVFPMSPMADRADYIKANVQLCTFTPAVDVDHDGVLKVGFDQGTDIDGDGFIDDGCPKNITKGLIVNKVALRNAISVSNSYPPNTGGALGGLNYSTDNVNAFKTSYTTDARCVANTSTYCRMFIYNTLNGGLNLTL